MPTTAPTFEIIEYAPEYHDDFRRLNHEWITRYFELEPADHLTLGDPQTHLLDPGGFILLARAEGKIVGSGALLHNPADHSWKLAKMAVTSQMQGRGIGFGLCQAILDRARTMGVKRVELVSNHILLPALHVYRKLGFREIPLGTVMYKRGTIRMAVDL
ncbi:GNAT family N-acetyltransferase [Hymenobacter chitinivorans]|uniref:Acetyltransferase (GNAT) family protein n=1 Tax=Hymenobacter chitinivorans DSM 11115 TaxID=1121954 RepID=A0A2M9B5U0_9BACT|nr:GNAT family N-acetyltransferase [Hymenobacter chitinivorans]PJJ53302.1 acetyltransferase (GNAT) family protein [Hymenobacter chitinivorans DSM 11115]